MMETETVVAQGTLKVDLLARRARLERSGRLASGLDAHDRPDPRRRSAAGRRRAARPRRDRHGAVAAHVARGAGRGRRVGRRSGPPARRPRAAASRTSEVSIEHSPRRPRSRSPPGPRRYRLHTYTAEDFPRLPGRGRCGPSRSTARRCSRPLARVSRSASRDESRPVLTGILVRFEAGKLVMAATDSYRLSVKETATRGRGARARGDHPGARARRARAHRTGRRRRSSSACTRTRSSSPPATRWLTTRRIDGQFPNYKQLLPEAFEHELTLPRDELLDVVRRVAVMAQRNSPLRLRFAEGELTVSAQTQDVGEATESLPVPFAGEPLEIGFNAEFLRDGHRVGRATSSCAEADHPAATRGSPGRRRRLPRT